MPVDCMECAWFLTIWWFAVSNSILGLCGWNDTSKGVFDWNRDRGGTPSSNTGPTVDHTLGK